MATNTKISYLEIPDEISLIIPAYSNLDDARKALEAVENKVSCIILDGDITRSQDAIDKMRYIKQDKNIKTAWFCYKKVIPYKAEYFNYIKTNDGLYLNIGNGISNRFIDISKYIETKDKLNQLDPYYFEKIDEINNRQLPYVTI